MNIYTCTFWGGGRGGNVLFPHYVMELAKCSPAGASTAAPRAPSPRPSTPPSRAALPLKRRVLVLPELELELELELEPNLVCASRGAARQARRRCLIVWAGGGRLWRRFLASAHPSIYSSGVLGHAGSDGRGETTPGLLPSQSPTIWKIIWNKSNSTLSHIPLKIPMQLCSN